MKEKGYKVKRDYCQVKRYCQTMNLKDSQELIEKYKECHNEANSWPEIREEIRSIGILEMEIYIEKNHLFMIIETPLNFDFNIAMKRLASLPLQIEWERYVSRFQECTPDSTSSEKWTLMERIFYLYK